MLIWHLPHPELPEYPLKELLAQEKEMTGVYCSAHPLDEYADYLSRLSFNTAELAALTEREDQGLSEDGKRVVMGGIIVETHGKVTRKGSMMGFMTLEDQTGQVECLLFPRVYELYHREIAVDQAVLVTGKLSVREDEDPKLLVDAIEPLAQGMPTGVSEPAPVLTDAQIAKAAPEKLYLRMHRDQIPAVREILSALAGEGGGPVPVYMNLPEEGITLLFPRDMWVHDCEKARQALLSLLPPEDIRPVRKA